MNDYDYAGMLLAQLMNTGRLGLPMNDQGGYAPQAARDFADWSQDYEDKAAELGLKEQYENLWAAQRRINAWDSWHRLTGEPTLMRSMPDRGAASRALDGFHPGWGEELVGRLLGMAPAKEVLGINDIKGEAGAYADLNQAVRLNDRIQRRGIPSYPGASRNPADGSRESAENDLLSRLYSSGVYY